MITSSSLGEKSSKFSYTHNQLKYLAWQMVSGLEYIHDMGFVHGFVSPETIRGLPDKKQICLAGFSPNREGSMFTAPDHPMYASNNELRGGMRDRVFDMHSLAYSLIVLAGGVFPWTAANTSYPSSTGVREHVS